MKNREVVNINIVLQLPSIAAVLSVNLFYSHITRAAQYEHPCAPHYIYQPEVRIQLEVATPRLLASPPRHTHFHPHSVLVPANPYLNQGESRRPV